MNKQNYIQHSYKLHCSSYNAWRTSIIFCAAPISVIKSLSSRISHSILSSKATLLVTDNTIAFAYYHDFLLPEFDLHYFSLLYKFFISKTTLDSSLPAISSTCKGITFLYLSFTFSKKICKDVTFCKNITFYWILNCS